MKFVKPGLVMLIGCFLCIGMDAMAQSGFSAGVKAGLTMTGQNVSDGADHGYKPGFQVGAYLAFSKAKLTYQADLVFSQQGSSVSSGGQDLTSTFSYVNVPLTLRYSLGPSWNLQAGPQVGFLTCAKSGYHPVTKEPFSTQDYTKAYNTVDAGINVGVGWTMPAGRFLAELRFYVGLTDIASYPGVAKTTNQAIQLTAGYRIFSF